MKQTNLIISAKLGVLTFSLTLVKEENAHIITKCFSALKFIPLEVKIDFFNNTIKYSGTSPMFNEIKEGIPIPEYDGTLLLEKVYKKGALLFQKYP